MTHHQGAGGGNDGGDGFFDPYAWETFFYGPLDRREAERLLAGAKTGTFLLRESTSKPGYSLTVKEADDQIYNYLIERTTAVQQKQEEEGGDNDKQLRYTISNLSFCDIPSLLSYFKLCKLERTNLQKPLVKPALDKVVARFKFEGERCSDLPFERGEVLDVLDKPEERWWMARNCLGNTGLIPVNYVKVYEEGDELSLQNPSSKSSGSGGGGDGKRFSAASMGLGVNDPSAANSSGGAAAAGTTIAAAVPNSGTTGDTPKLQPNAWVRVLADRWPSIYDVAAMNIRQGQLLWLQEVLTDGMCRGVNEDGRAGLFPITYVEPLSSAEMPPPWNPDAGTAGAAES